MKHFYENTIIKNKCSCGNEKDISQVVCTKCETEGRKKRTRIKKQSMKKITINLDKKIL